MRNDTSFWKIYIKLSLVIVLSMLAVLIINSHYYPLFQDDMLNQSYHFLLDLKNRPLNEFLSFWDWNSFMGADYYKTTVFYYSLYPLNYVVKFLPLSLAPYYYFIIQVINLLLLAFFSLKWTSYVTSNSLARFAGALFFVFNGWTIAYFKYPFLHYFWILPIMMIATEKYIAYKKAGLLVFSVACCALMNYYFAFLYMPFLFLYAVYRYFVVHRPSSVKCVFADGGLYAIYYLLGIGTAAVAVYPALVHMLSTPRLSSGNTGMILSLKQIFRFVTGLFTPVMASNNHNYFISSSLTDTWLTYGGGPVIYSGILSLFLFPQYFYLYREKKYERNSAIVLWSFILLLVGVKGLYRFLNGNWDSRWMFMIPVFFSYFLVKVLEKREKLSSSLLKQTGIGLTLTIVACYAVSWKMNWYDNVDTLRQLLHTMAFVLTLSFFYGMGRVFHNERKVNVLLIAEVLLLLSGEFIFTSGKGLSDLWITKQQFKESYLLENPAIDYVKSLDSGVYRIAEENKKEFSSNNTLSQNFMGFTYYSSLYNFEQEDFLNGRFKGYEQWHFLNNSSNWQLKNLFATKYLIDYSGTAQIPPSYTLIQSFGDIQVYQNKYFLPLGFAMDYELSSSVYDKLTLFEQDRVLLNTLVIDESTQEEIHFVDKKQIISSGDFGSTLYSLDRLNGVIYVLENTEYSYMISRGFEIYQNHELDTLHENKKTDYPIAIFVEPEDEELYVHLSSKELLGYEITYDLVYDDLIWMDSWYDSLIDEAFYNVSIQGDTLTAEIDLKNKKWIFTSVAYDKNWKVFVDGQEVEIVKANDGFIAFNADEGHHQIMMKYYPKDTIIGAIISVIALMLCFFLMRKNRRKNEKYR